ncbi:MAG: hypothetical protein IJN09_03425 [Oscillospiraceae bacterium]|nr:hypothetical protein [Oscillospiraceae bacterium]MBQ7119620.1 hypothetical protein [Oscillospiraceae bacterium]
MTAEFIGEGFMSLITADLYLVIAAVYGICFALKKAKFFPDRFIPLAAIILGVLFELPYILASGGNVSEGIAKGVITGMAAVYVANVIKQMGEKKE